MAVKIRLRRLGRRKRPLYGVVAADARSPRDGRFIEDLGRYNPMEEPAVIKLDKERVLYWLEQGAQPTDTVRSILSREGLMLALHMRRKGSEADAVWEAVEAHRTRHTELQQQGRKTTARDRKEAALKAEAAAAATAAAAEAKARAEAEEKARVAAEEARKQAEEQAKAERESVADAAKAEQEARNEAQATADAGDTEAAGATDAAEASAEETPEAASEAAEKSEAGESDGETPVETVAAAEEAPEAAAVVESPDAEGAGDEEKK